MLEYKVYNYGCEELNKNKEGKKKLDYIRSSSVWAIGISCVCVGVRAPVTTTENEYVGFQFSFELRIDSKHITHIE